MEKYGYAQLMEFQYWNITLYQGEFTVSNWEYYNTENSEIPSNMVKSILFEENNKIWIGSTSGLCLKKMAQWDVQTFETEGIYSNNIKKIIKNSSDQKIYIGTLNGGLYT